MTTDLTWDSSTAALQSDEPQQYWTPAVSPLKRTSSQGVYSMWDSKPVNPAHSGTQYTYLQRLLTLAPNVLTVDVGCDVRCPLENSLIWPFPAGSWPLPFPRLSQRFRIAPLLAAEWTGKVKLKAVFCWEYSAYWKEWWLTDNCLAAHPVKVVLLYLKALLGKRAWQSFWFIAGVKVWTVLEGADDEAKLACLGQKEPVQFKAIWHFPKVFFFFFPGEDSGDQTVDHHVGCLWQKWEKDPMGTNNQMHSNLRPGLYSLWQIKSENMQQLKMTDSKLVTQQELKEHFQLQEVQPESWKCTAQGEEACVTQRHEVELGDGIWRSISSLPTQTILQFYDSNLEVREDNTAWHSWTKTPAMGWSDLGEKYLWVRWK